MSEEYIEMCDEPWSGRAAGALGKGLIAGIIGTIAITISQQIEMKKTGRQPSTTPLQAAQKVFQFNPESEQATAALNNMVHFGYGTTLGIIRGVLKMMGIGGIFGTILHIGAIQGLSMTILPKLNLAPPSSEWDKKTIQTEMIHHAVYAIVAGIVFDWMSRCIRKKF